MPDGSEGRSAVGFPTTLWSVISHAGKGSAKALETLAGSYRPAVLRLVGWFLNRRRLAGHDPEDATQEFFAYLLTHREAILGRADRTQGKFRAWFRTCLTNWLRTWEDGVRAQKRGGGRRVASLDDSQAAVPEIALEEKDIAVEFDRQWAKQVLAVAFRRLREDEESGRLSKGDVEIFDLKHGDPPRSHAEIAKSRGMDLNAVVVSVRRTLRRLKEHLRDELQPTAATEKDLTAEIEGLFEALAG